MLSSQMDNTLSTHVSSWKLLTCQSVLSREEAKARLKKLCPGTEEHCKLQHGLIKTAGIVEVSLRSMSYKVNTTPRDFLLRGGFGSPEHMKIGKMIDVKELEAIEPIMVVGTVSLHFHHIVALAGDVYAVVKDGAISLPEGTDGEKKVRFMNAFATLEQADHNQLRVIVQQFDNEYFELENNCLPRHCYSSHLMEKSRALAKIKPDVNELLIDNSDHFSKDARNAYSLGHAWAIEVAKEAGRKQDQGLLKKAYAIDAFACHFLTDLFSAGHIRNQRGELETFLNRLGFSKNIAKKLAGVLTGAQHEKDGKEGLSVFNGKGERWRAYGDGCFNTSLNKENQLKVIEATRESVKEISQAYKDHDTDLVSTIKQHIPIVASDLNLTPLYSVTKDDPPRLILHLYNGPFEVKTKRDYLFTGFSHAMRDLPQDYIDNFVDYILGIQMLTSADEAVFRDKVLLPQLERFSGQIWHVIGLATYIQTKRNHEQLSSMIREIAGEVKQLNRMNVKTAEQLNRIESKVQVLVDNDTFKDIYNPIKDIVGIVDKILKWGPMVAGDPAKLERYEIELFDAYSGLSLILRDGDVKGNNIVALFSDHLRQQQSEPDDVELRIAMTLWFRQVIEYQKQAFSLSKSLEIMRSRAITPEFEKQVRVQVGVFDKNIEEQIKNNSGLINPELVIYSREYIALQLEKHRTIKTINRN